MPQTKNRFLLFLNAIGRALIGDLNGPQVKKITPLDIHTVNGHIEINGVSYSADEAFSIAVEIMKRVK